MPIFSIPPNVVTGGVIQATDVSDLYNYINGQLDYQNISGGGIRGSNIANGTIGVGALKTAFATVGVQQAAARHFGGGFFQLPSGAFSFWPGLYTDSSSTLTSGTATVTNGSPNVAWASGNNFVTGGRWSTPTKLVIVLGGVNYNVSSVTNATNLVLTQNYAASNGTVAYSVTEVTIGTLSGNVVNDTDNDISVANPTGLARIAGSTTPTGMIWLGVLNAVNTATNQAFCNNYYIQASPPYDLGDGDIPIFTFVAIDSGGSVVMSYAAPDPPWAQSIVPTAALPVSLGDVLADPSKMDAFVAGVEQGRVDMAAIGNLMNSAASARSPELKSNLLNQAAVIAGQTLAVLPDKNAMMSEIPHPFMANDLSGLTVTMLDPVSKTSEQLAYLHDQGENVAEILHKGLVKVGDTVNRASSPGVPVMSISWKNSK